ncbi:MAG: hypothetical protein AAFX58_01125 [Pseudomonadota bacterium]
MNGIPLWAAVLDGIGTIALGLGLFGYFSPETTLLAPWLHLGRQAGALLALGILLMGPFYYFLIRRITGRHAG